MMTPMTITRLAVLFLAVGLGSTLLISRRFRHGRIRCLVRRIHDADGTRAVWLGVLLLAVWIVAGLSTVGGAEDAGTGKGLSIVYHLLGLLMQDSDLEKFLSTPPAEINSRDVLTLIALLSGRLAVVLFPASRVIGPILRGSNQWIAGRLSQHTVIVGAGNAAEALVVDIAKTGQGFAVVITDGVDSAAISRLGALGAIVLRGYESDKVSQWARPSALRRAARVFVACGTDSQNIACADNARTQMNNDARERHRAQVVPLVEDALEFSRISKDRRYLGAENIPEPNEQLIKIEPFARAEAAASRLLAKQPLGEIAALMGAPQVHLLLVGFGDVAEMVLLHALQDGMRTDLAAPRVTVLTENPTEDSKRFWARFPELEEYNLSTDPTAVLSQRVLFKTWVGEELSEAELDQIDEGLDESSNSRQQPALDGRGDWEGLPAPPKFPVTSIVVDLRKDFETSTAAVSVHRHIERCRRWRAPVFVSTRRGGTTGNSKPRAQQAREGRALEQTVESFGLDAELCTVDTIFNRPEDETARVLHMHYDLSNPNSGVAQRDAPWRFDPTILERTHHEVWNRTAQPPPFRHSPGRGRWSRLHQTFYRASVRQGAHLPVKLAMLGYRRAGAPSGSAGVGGPWLEWDGQGALGMPLAEVARLEHERWCIQTTTEALRFGPERDNVELAHPQIIAWDAPLDFAEKRKDYDHVHAIPYFVAAANRDTWLPEVRIGYVGPVNLRGRSEELIRRNIRRTLAEIRTSLDRAFANKKKPAQPGVLNRHPGYVVTVVCCLADGTDLMFADLAMAAFGLHTPRLVVPRPLPWRDPPENQAARVQSDARRAILRRATNGSSIIDLMPTGWSDRTGHPAKVESFLQQREEPEPNIRNSKEADPTTVEKTERINRVRREFWEDQYKAGTEFVCRHSDVLVTLCLSEASELNDVGAKPSEGTQSSGLAPRAQIDHDHPAEARRLWREREHMGTGIRTWGSNSRLPETLFEVEAPEASVSVATPTTAASKAR